MAFSSKSYYKRNHVPQIQECSQSSELNDLVGYIKTSNVSTLRDCSSREYQQRNTFWAPTIESSKTANAFITKTPDEIYRSDKPPIVDAMFSFATQVCSILSNQLSRSQCVMYANLKCSASNEQWVHIISIERVRMRFTRFC